MSKSSSPFKKLRVIIAGGRVAALETALALADLAPDRTDVTVVAPNTEFVYRPMVVREHERVSEDQDPVWKATPPEEAAPTRLEADVEALRVVLGTVVGESTDRRALSERASQVRGHGLETRSLVVGSKRYLAL